ncbi:MAG TPA: group 1 glycosyl transferase [Acidisarcina sp.]
MRRAACTIVSANYLPYARTFCQSFRMYHPSYELYVLLVDRIPPALDLAAEDFILVPVEELGIPNFPSIAFLYDILELNTNVKPTFLKWLLARGVQQLIYFDPDICVYSNADVIYDLLQTSNIIITPHITRAPEDKQHLLEQELLSLGTFNLGFVAVSGSAESLKFLDWWEERCLEKGFADPRNALFVDQKWVNLAPAMFDGVLILKHPGCNMAHWNIHERHLTRAGDSYRVNDAVPLIFYHFSGFKAAETTLVSGKDRSGVTIEERPDLGQILSEYRNLLLGNGLKECESYPYAFGVFEDGQPITALARRVYSFKRSELPAANPFAVPGGFHDLAKRTGLLGTKDRSGKFNALNYDKDDWRIRSINRLLKLALRVLGCDRYTMLMKYISYISILRNQEELF